jgi:hypothetical protein
MERETAILSRLAADSREYLKLEVEAVQVRLYKKLSNTLTSSVMLLTIIALGAFCLLFAAAGLAFLVGEKLGSIKAGFFIVASLFLVLTLAAYFISNSTRTSGLRDRMAKVVSGKNSYLELEDQEVRISNQLITINGRLTANLEELKAAADKVNSDVNRVRSLFTPGEPGGSKSKMIYSILDLALNKFVLRKAGLAGTVLPLVAGAVVPGGAVHTAGKSIGGFLKRRFGKFFSRPNS